ncbi:MAG: helix-turn-helix domain-containing protein [Acidobacteriota bacterium]|jgi:DNA-binding protein Fis|nr:helix-turn-helix domain-containing protein [Acidobacteriota bacterium]
MNDNALSFKERMDQVCRELVDVGILFPEAVGQFELCFIQEVLSRNGGNLARSAEVLGIHRNTLAKKVGRRKG